MRYDKAEFKAAYGTFGQLPESDLPEIAFAGRSNVGKSSLLNKLFEHKNCVSIQPYYYTKGNKKFCFLLFLNPCL